MIASHSKIRFLISVGSLSTACILLLTHPSIAQQPMPTATNRTAAPLPCSANEGYPALLHARSLLADVNDGEFGFDDDAFYAFCRYVKSPAGQSFSTSPTTEPKTSDLPIPWRFLLERPRDYRGQFVMVEGRLLAKTGFQVAEPLGEELGTLYQCELGNPDTRGICTVVVIEPPSRVAIHSRVRVQGYFIKTRAFETTAEEVRSGPLLVARRLQPMVESTSVNQLFSNKDHGLGIWLAGGTGILAFIWFILRRRLRRLTRDRDISSAALGAQPSAEDDFAWMSANSDHDDTAQD